MKEGKCLALGEDIILPGPEAVTPGGRGDSSSSPVDFIEIKALYTRRRGWVRGAAQTPRLHENMAP